ncbi:MAG: YchF/TatD family DNA exonuclease [Magnetococcales bacterium]|nr:YchF/TatD family DNA exonuclease [Magnetococcales bacterium]MBF0155976.1 YchF/TatD family DNA exonuclease [Magnetococcales bacterium]
MSTLAFADSHAHLDFADFAGELDQVLARARAAGVTGITTIGIDLEGGPRRLEIAEAYEGVTLSVGIHPHNADRVADASLEAIMAAVNHPKVVAIGETGLDYHYLKSGREGQLASFRNHIRAALATNLPLVIHSREAEADTRTILESEGAKHCGGVIHCFSGSADFARWGLEQGYHLSFSGIVTFRNAKDLQEIAKAVPLERLLIETDSPYLAPVPYRGKRNEPAYVVEVAKCLAALRSVPLETIATATRENTSRLFRPRTGTDARGETLAYTIDRGRYLNITAGCTLKCGFCPKWKAPRVHHYDLSLSSNPSAAAIIAAAGDVSAFEEVVFCGFGEPTLRLDTLLEVARSLKERYSVPIRVNTDGLACRVRRQDVTPRFAGIVDAVSVSLNAQSAEVYDRHCHPGLSGSYEAVKAFILAVKQHVPKVTATAISGLEGVDIEACRAIAEEELGVHFRVRYLDRLG